MALLVWRTVSLDDDPVRKSLDAQRSECYQNGNLFEQWPCLLFFDPLFSLSLTTGPRACVCSANININICLSLRICIKQNKTCENFQVDSSTSAVAHHHSFFQVCVCVCAMLIDNHADCSMCSSVKWPSAGTHEHGRVQRRRRRRRAEEEEEAHRCR